MADLFFYGSSYSVSDFRAGDTKAKIASDPNFCKTLRVTTHDLCNFVNNL